MRPFFLSIFVSGVYFLLLTPALNYVKIKTVGDYNG